MIQTPTGGPLCQRLILYILYNGLGTLNVRNLAYIYVTDKNYMLIFTTFMMIPVNTAHEYISTFWKQWNRKTGLNSVKNLSEMINHSPRNGLSD
jgi:hypothetical protein